MGSVDTSTSSGTQNSATTQNTLANGTSSGSTTRDPWAAAIPGLTGLLSQIGSQYGAATPTDAETGALAGLNQNADNSRAPMNDAVNHLQAGGSAVPHYAGDIYDQTVSQLTPTILGNYTNPATNPFFSDTVNAISRDAGNKVSNMFAGSGRDPAGAGAYGYNVGKGVGEATAPIFSDVYNRERTNQLGAINSMAGAGNDLIRNIGSLDNQQASNITAGQSLADAPYSKILGAEAYRRNIPLSALASLVGLTTPIAGLGGGTSATGTTSGTTNTTGTNNTTASAEKTPSTLDTLAKLFS